MTKDKKDKKDKKIGLNRDITDKFYTKDETVSLCLEKVKEFLRISKDDLIIEPSAGNGAFIPGIKSLCDNHIFLDLIPEDKEIIQQDYLTFSPPRDKKNKRIHLIGNPPFGRQSSLAIQFIKKSCQFCDTLSFILPKSFKKESLKKHYPLNFHNLTTIDLPSFSFLVNGKEYDVPCVFQIWEKREFNREEVKKLQPISFLFVKREENPDISFRRVGVNAGHISQDIENKSIQSHYFIKFGNRKSLEENLRLLKDITFETDNTVGPKSISKGELIEKFNTILLD